MIDSKRMDLVEKATKGVLEWQKRAIATYSNVKVGAAVIADGKEWGDNKSGIVYACNIEISKRKGIHAEQLAVYDALKFGYKQILAVVVTSQSFEEQAALCDECRGFFAKVNPEIRVIVVNPNGSIKLDLRLDRDLRPYSYNG